MTKRRDTTGEIVSYEDMPFEWVCAAFGFSAKDGRDLLAEKFRKDFKINHDNYVLASAVDYAFAINKAENGTLNKNEAVIKRLFDIAPKIETDNTYLVTTKGDLYFKNKKLNNQKFPILLNQDDWLKYISRKEFRVKHYQELIDLILAKHRRTITQDGYKTFKKIEAATYSDMKNKKIEINYLSKSKLRDSLENFYKACQSNLTSGEKVETGMKKATFNKHAPMNKYLGMLGRFRYLK